MSKSNSNLYSLAKLAKKRLRENSYKENRILLTTNPSPIIIKHETKTTTITVINNKDELLYQKVCDLLSRGNTLNPVGQLIDQKIFSSLDMEAKQKYIYNLTEKYKELKLRYYKEHPYNFATI